MISKLCQKIASIAKDKILHFLIAYIALDYSLSIGKLITNDYLINFVIALAIVIVLVFLKETIDEIKYGGWDWKDIFAGYIGIIAKTIAYTVQVV